MKRSKEEIIERPGVKYILFFCNKYNPVMGMKKFVVTEDADEITLKEIENHLLKNFGHGWQWCGTEEYEEGKY